MCLLSRHRRPSLAPRALAVAIGLSLAQAWAGAQSTLPAIEIPPPATTSPAATQVDAATAQQQRQLQIFGPILLNPSDDIAADTRRNAAAEILDMQIPEATDVLRQALQSRRPVVAMSAAAALQAQQTLPPGLLEPCVAALGTASGDVVTILSTVLARYGDDAAARVSDLALKPGAPARLNAIAALGSFRTRTAAAALMRVIQRAATGPNPLLDPVGTESLAAAIASLQRMTGLAYGQDLDAWQAWWARAAGDSDEQWYRLVSESLATRAGLLEQQLQEQKLATDRTSRELFATYRDLFPALPIDEQLRRLPHLLQDKLAPVRQFGLSRVAVLTRDSVRIAPEIVDLVRARVNDESADLRNAAADLLDELNDERAAEVVAARLAIETNSTVLATLLEVIARRPTASAVAPVLRLLAEDVVADAAADALWQILLVMPDSNSPQAQQAIRDAARRRLSTSTIRLAGLAGDDRDVIDLTELLDGGDRDLRAAVAEGFWKRGLRQPLIDRAYDDAVYPFALRALADGPADLASFNLLIGLKPSEPERRLWAEMVVRLASRLQPADLPTAEDSLRNLAYADAALRRDVLLAGAALPRDTLPAPQRMQIVERLAPVLLELGEAQRAWDLLESLNGAASSNPALRVVQFQAAALTGHYDRAAAIQNDSAAWVSLLGREVEKHNPACPRLHDEIMRRYGETLSPADRQRMSELATTLQGGEQRA